MQAGQEQPLGLAMRGRGSLSPQLPGTTAGERAELTPQQSAVCSGMPRARGGRRGVSQGIPAARLCCVPFTAGSLHESAGASQPARQLGLQLAFPCRLPLAQLQPKLLSPPESAGKTHGAGIRAPVPLRPPHHQRHHHPNRHQEHPAIEPTLLTGAQPAGGKSRDEF